MVILPSGSDVGCLPSESQTAKCDFFNKNSIEPRKTPIKRASKRLLSLQLSIDSGIGTDLDETFIKEAVYTIPESIHTSGTQKKECYINYGCEFEKNNDVICDNDCRQNVYQHAGPASPEINNLVVSGQNTLLVTKDHTVETLLNRSAAIQSKIKQECVELQVNSTRTTAGNRQDSKVSANVSTKDRIQIIDIESAETFNGHATNTEKTTDSPASKRTWGTCKTKINEMMESFAGETTAHGYKRTLRETRSSTGKFLWVLAILAATACVTKSLWIAASEEHMYAFISRIHSEPHSYMAFPAVTVCSLARYENRTMDFLASFSANSTEEDISDTKWWRLIKTGPANDTSPALTKEMKDDFIRWERTSFIKECFWNDETVPCKDVLVRAKSSNLACFTFNSDATTPKTVDRAGSLSGLGLRVNLDSSSDRFARSGIRVLIHDANVIPNAEETGVLVSSSTITYIGLWKREYRFLPRPYKSYGTDYCSDDYSTKESPNHYNVSGYTACMAECRLQTILKKCACVVLAGDPDVPSVPVCTLSQVEQCYRNASWHFYTELSKNKSTCPCPLPCTKIEYQGQISAASLPEFDAAGPEMKFIGLPPQQDEDGVLDGNTTDPGRSLELKVYMDNLFTHIEEHVPKHKWFTIFGLIGGQMGLFTGASVLTLLEFVEFLLLIFLTMAQFGYSSLCHKIWSPRQSGDLRETSAPGSHAEESESVV